jgi:dihydroorotase/N-acyl-D-amino-acid deacylase
MKKLLLFVLAFSSLFALAQGPQYDVLIRNGKVVDGSGNPWFYADVGIVGDRIAFIGHADANVTAKRTIDAKGLVVAPGFIDMLGQSEVSVLIDKRAMSKVTQGVTTEITGEGESVAPQNDFTISEGKDFLEHYHLTVDWRTLDEYFKRLEKNGSGVNIGTYVGATQVREMVLGKENRAPNEEELKQEVEYVEDAMLDGALGVSTSLIYAPANYANTDELIALAKAASKHGGIYSSHMRNEGDNEMQALDEAFRIGREANIPVEIWHFKVSGSNNWGKMKDVIAKVEAARASGLDVTADQYPYVAAATSLGATIPPQYHAGGEDAFVKRLQDPAVRKQIHDELIGVQGHGENLWRGASGGPEGILVVSVLNPALKKYEGQTVAQIAKAQGKDPFDALLDFVVADRDNTGAVYFLMSEEDVRLAMQQPWVAVDTDYGAVATDGPLSESKSHPRAWGTFPRILGKYVREEHVLRLEDAIRKMTSLAAQRVQLVDRGLLRTGYFADVTVFDPENVLDVATFEIPNRPAAGINYVFVNGVLELDQGKMTSNLGGRPLRGPAYTGGPDEGQPPKGKIEGVVTDEQGWGLGRVLVSVVDPSNKVVAQGQTKYLGRFEIPLDQPCATCTLRVARDGFDAQERALDFNGANSLWFGFALKRHAYSDSGLRR